MAFLSPSLSLSRARKIERGRQKSHKACHEDNAGGGANLCLNVLSSARPGLVEPESFKREHAEMLAKLPPAAQPPNAPHGRLSYTCLPQLDTGEECKIEIHVKGSGFARIVKPVVEKGKATFNFSNFTSPEEGWNAAVKFCAKTLGHGVDLD